MRKKEITTPMDQTGRPVNNHSPPEAKIALFRSL